MGVFMRVLVDACTEKLDEVAKTIEGEMKAEVSKGAGKARGIYATGAAVGAIHIEDEGEFARFVGGTHGEGTQHMYWLNEGNGGHQIYPVRAKALHLQSPGLDAYAKSVRPYAGEHYIEKIAARHGGY